MRAEKNEPEIGNVRLPRCLDLVHKHERNELAHPEPQLYHNPPSQLFVLYNGQQ